MEMKHYIMGRREYKIRDFFNNYFEIIFTSYNLYFSNPVFIPKIKNNWTLEGGQEA